MTAARRLAAILAADVVGFSRLVGADEPGTLARLAALRAETLDPLLAAHGGRVFKSMGDGLFVEFSSGVQAVQCAVAIQQALAASADALQLRIGLHSADVAVQPDGDLLGDGVNIAARIEALAEPGGICISGQVRENAAGKISLEMEDLGTPELKNIAQPVRVFRVRLGAAERRALPLPDKPSLAVLPFQNMSGDLDQEYFADGVVEDIITALSRVGSFFVIARNSSFSYKGRSPDIRTVGRELGVRYVLEGSVRRALGRVRITCQLIETATGHHVWTDRFDRELADIFDMQDRITESVVGAIEPSLTKAEIARASTKPTDSQDAYDLYLKALAYTHGDTGFDRNIPIDLLHRALVFDPSYGRAKALLAFIIAHGIGGVTHTDADSDLALSLARDAIATAHGDPDVLARAGFVLSYVGGEKANALSALNAALVLNPNSAFGLMTLGMVHCHANIPDAAMTCFERAMKLSPRDPTIGFMYHGLGLAYLLKGYTQQALDHLTRASLLLPRNAQILRSMLIAYDRLGRSDDARDTAARLTALGPNALVYGTPQTRGPAYRMEYEKALRSAGVRE